MIDEGSHALISSAKNLGEATAVLPVVSTLSFGFAAAELLAQGAEAHTSVVILLAASAALSLYTTTFSVLEYYYIALLTSSDTRQYYALATGEDEDTEAASNAAATNRDRLARQTDELVLFFRQWRKNARNALWASVILIIAASAAQTIEVRGLQSRTTIAVIVILSAGGLLVPITVYRFRTKFGPLLAAYRAATGLTRQAGRQRLPARTPSTSEVAPAPVPVANVK